MKYFFNKLDEDRFRWLGGDLIPAESQSAKIAVSIRVLFESNAAWHKFTPRQLLRLVLLGRAISERTPVQKSAVSSVNGQLKVF